MNWNEKEEMLDRLMENLAGHMIRRGTIISDRERSNPYCCIRIINLVFRGKDFMITKVDGKTCRIDKE